MKANMKTTTTLKTISLIALLTGVLAMPVLAEAGGGMGQGTGGGMGMQNAGPGNGMRGQGMGAGAGGRGHGMRFNQNNMTGWSLMTAEERSAQQAKMRSAGSLAECQSIQAEHRSVMEARAKEKGITLPTPRQNGCQRMASRGFFTK